MVNPYGTCGAQMAIATKKTKRHRCKPEGIICIEFTCAKTGARLCTR